MSRGRAGRLGWVVPALAVAFMVALVASALHARWTALRVAEGYREAVSDALGVSMASGAADLATALPDARVLAGPTMDLRVGFFDMLEVQGCQLGVLIGERNSPLGRVMARSERLIYELRLLRALPRCEIDADEAELARELRAAVQIKQAELPLHLTRALWGGPELRALLSAQVEGDSLQHAAPAAHALAALAAFAREPTKDPESVREPLSRLHKHRAAGGVLRQARLAVGVLEAVASAVQHAEGCSRARKLQTAFRHHYVGAFQPQLARLREPLDELTAALRALWQAGPQPAALQPYATATFSPGPRGLSARLLEASRRHAAAMNAYATQCRITLVPG